MDSRTPVSQDSHIVIPGTSIRIGRVEFIAIIATMMAMNALAIDIVLPALPQIGDALGAGGENARQHVLTAYILGFGGAQLLFGPLSDRFGRKPPLIAGMALYVIAGLAGGLATEFWFLLLARFIQGIGAASSRVLAVSIVRDIYGGRRMAEVMSVVMMVFMLTPLAAPALGQMVILFGPWQLVFAFMSLIALAGTLWFHFRLPETLRSEDRRPFTPASIYAGFRTVLTNRTALFYSLGGMAMFGSLFGFITTAQQIFVDIYDLGALFPLIFAFTAGAMAISSLLNSRIVGRIGMRRLSHFSLFGFILTALAWAAWTIAFGGISLAGFLTFFILCNFFFGWIGANFNAIAMEPLAKVAGTGSAVVGFLHTAGGGLIGAVIGQAFDGTTLPIAISYVIVGFVTLVFILLAERGRLFGVGSGV